MKLRRGVYIAGLAGLVNLSGCCGVRLEKAENEYLRQREFEEGRDYSAENYFSERTPVFTLFRFSFGFGKGESDSRKDYDIFSGGLDRK